MTYGVQKLAHRLVPCGSVAVYTAGPPRRVYMGSACVKRGVGLTKHFVRMEDREVQVQKLSKRLK